jgi:hypothetical protein
MGSGTMVENEEVKRQRMIERVKDMWTLRIRGIE